MRVARILPAFLVLISTVAACSGGPTKKELEAASALKADSLFYIRNELLAQVMEGSKFVNEINQELARVRSINLGAARELAPGAELTDANDERRQVVSRITKLVERLDAVTGRVAGLRKELSDKDSTLKTRVAEYEQMVADVSLAAEKQRTELQAVIDGQTVRIAALTQQLDTLTGTLGQLTSDHNTVYVVVGTREELMKKGILVAEGTKRFGLVGGRSLLPARELDPSTFTKLDRRSDRTIVLPAGEYRIVSRQNSAYVTSEASRKGRLAGGFTIDEPERFWNGSRFLILMKS
jgi:hypothetical protein